MDSLDDGQKYDRAKVGYSTAIALITYEGQLIWRAFAAMLGVNGIMVTAAGFVLNNFPDFKVVSFVLSILGLIICLAWFLAVRRMFSYYRYWFAWARHFERNFLAPVVQITTVGRVYSEGSTSYPTANSYIPDLPRFGWAARIFRVEVLILLVIAVFVVLHATIFSVFMKKYLT